MACGTCGAPQRDGAKFCDECGAPHGGLQDGPTYKQVTVLFADVVRSMELAATLDLERLREVMGTLVGNLAAIARRYGGTVEYNGDGIMALFGAPIALEDHAFRGCLAALAIQDEAGRLGDAVAARDGATLQVRVGLNSGRVIAGELKAAALGYAATGRTVGFAQRMESVAPPGGVMLSEETARLVEGAVVLGAPESLRLKDSDEPVRGRRLLAVTPREGAIERAEAGLVGRRWEMAAIDAIVDRAISGRGGVVNVVGPPGIGKSRVAREAAALAAERGVEVAWGFCESHATDVPFYAVTRLLRAASGIATLDDAAARARLLTLVPADADSEDVLLLHDLLDVADPDVALPRIDPDARRRRLTALINATSLARSAPALFIVEDAHWVDATSESMLADFLAIVARTRTMVLITARPEYAGALTKVRGAHAIALDPLSDSDIAALLGELLGEHPSVGELAVIIADRAAGNPFFAEEMVRELVQRGALSGERGRYVCETDVADLDVPATVQAAIEARIDRLSAAARRTLSAASVIGARFQADLLARLDLTPAFDELLEAELIDQVRFTPHAEFAFRHPLIRAVAYESQLKSGRAQWHRHLATVIRDRDPASADEHAALIAEHLLAAGELAEAYGWHMRAGAWSADRDIGAARINWERARVIADRLPDGPERLPLRIAPRTMLRATDWQAHVIQENWGRFDELRELCDEAGDRVSLAIGMTGLASELLYSKRSGEGARLASEYMALLEQIGDPNLTVGLAFIAFANWFNSGHIDEILYWSQRVIDLAAGDPVMGAGFGIGSPLAVTLAFRGLARWWLGRSGWRQDLDDAMAMARDRDPTTVVLVVTWTQGALFLGVLRVDDDRKRLIEETARTAEASSKDFALTGARFGLAVTLLYRDDAADRQRGLLMSTHVRDTELSLRAPSLVPVIDVCIAREQFKIGDRDSAISAMRAAVNDLYADQRMGWTVFASALLAETLAERGAEGDMAEAREHADRLATLLDERPSAIVEITLLRLRALLARAVGDDAGYRDALGRHRDIAHRLGYEGHLDWAERMANEPSAVRHH